MTQLAAEKRRKTADSASPLPGIDRRRMLGFLAGTVAAFHSPAAHSSPSDAPLTALLDALARDLEANISQNYQRVIAGAATRLKALHADGLSPRGRIILAVVRTGVEAEAALAKHHPFGKPGGSASPYVLHPRSGAFLKVFSLLGNAQDPARLSTLSDAIDRETAQFRADAERGVVPPAFLLARTIEQIAPVRAKAAADAGMATISAALDRQLAALAALRPRAPAQPGVWGLRDGDAYYRRALSLATGADIDPIEAHRWGVETVRALHSRADTLLKAQGLTDGSVAARLRAMAQDERYLYPATDEGKNRAVADMNAQLAKARSRIAGVFRGLSPAALSVERIPPHEEAAGRGGGRVDPSYDGTKAGAYFVDLREIRRRPSWTLPSVVHHELVPGHLLQAPFQEIARPHAMQLRYAGSYSEGWAIYAEQLAHDLGWFEGEPLAELGYLQWLLFRVGRLVADTGIHAMRWSREQTIQNLREIQGDSIAFITIEEDVERICAQPGAAAGQMLAARAIVDLRATAKARLGDRFDLAAFHQAMLAHGPLSVAGMKQAALSL